MKKAFTMLELVFVIVVIGILSATMIPNMQSDKTREAAIQLVSHIRYTQHLAMVDDKYDANDASWYKGRWQIVFNKGVSAGNELAYTIYSDGSGYTGTASSGEIAKDPSNKSKLLSGGSAAFNITDSKANKKLNLGMSYGITTDVASLMSGGCNGSARISFDHLGRPLAGTMNTLDSLYATGTTNKLMQTTCNIILTGSDGTVTIEIEPETGYAHII